MRQITLTPVLAIAMLALSGCSLTTGTWTGVFYPDGILTSGYTKQEGFTSKEACLSWARAIKEKRNNPADDYECGYGCRDNGYGVDVCKVTVDS